MYQVFYVPIFCFCVLLRTLFRVKPCRANMSKALKRLRKIADIDALLNTPRNVKRYFSRTTFRDYQWLFRITGHEGMHSLTRGKSLMDLVARYVDANQKVHELGFGKGANLLYLTRLFPSIRASGVDLTPAHVAVARDRLIEAGVRATIVQGDYRTHEPSEAQDVVFAIEALCYSQSERDAADVCDRVSASLKPNGVFVMIDGFLHDNAKNVQDLDNESKTALDCLSFGFRLTRLYHVDVWKKAAAEKGLVLDKDSSLKSEVMPFWTLGWSLAMLALTMPSVVRRYVKGRPKDREETFANLVAVSMVAPLLQCDLADYRILVFRKPLH